MSHVTETQPVPPGEAPANRRLSPGAREDLKTVAYWISLGAAAGGLGGLLVGGIGGRVAMFVLRLTSDESVRGIQSDDDFTIGRFDLVSTLNLLAATTLLGIVVGLIVVAGRPFFPKRGMPFAWLLAGGFAGGGILVQQDGVDFTLLGPHWLAVAMFVAIPALGAGLIAWLTEIYPRFWWKRRRLTALAAILAIPMFIIFPVAVIAGFVGGAWFLAMQWPRARCVPGWLPARVAAMAVFGLIVTLGLLDLVKDARAII